MKSLVTILAVLSASLVSLLGAGTAHAAQVNLITLTCVKYQNEILAAPPATPAADGINTVMWLFGYSVGKSGAHVMYGDALAGFGFGLDAECKNNPSESLMDALGKIKPSDKNPMDLATLDCLTFSTRHVELERTDRESADTIMMWLFGYSSAKSGSHFFDAERLPTFESTFLGECTKHPERSLFDTLSTLKL
jgi:HdeA/HdeB family